MQFYDLSQTSLAKSGSSIVEEYIPLWMADGGWSGTSGAGGKGINFIVDGGSYSSSSNSGVRLFSLSSNWSTNQLYALEMTCSQSGGTGYYALWDFSLPTPAIVSGSQISGSSNDIRSGQFTLTPGHQYGITFWNSSSSYTTYFSDASLIVFG